MRGGVASFTISAFACFVGCAAWALDTAPPNPSHPWEKDQYALKELETAVGSAGIIAIKEHVADLENALAHAKLYYLVDEENDRVAYTLVDGPAEALIAMAMATMDHQDKKITQSVAAENPYPHISFLLGNYYNEVGRPDDALRVLNAGLALSGVSGMDLGEHRAELISEKGAALVGLHRWQDMLANYDEGLKIDDLANPVKARMERGRGLALTELGRLDEADAAYKQSLTHEPGNTRALNELTYIARLRAGAAPTAPTLFPLKDPAASPPNTQH
jgi:tetratricopeptide (TPR) repeat protein